MPKQYTVTVYKFEELDEKAKEAARDWYRQAEAETFDAEDFKENVLCEYAAYHHRLKTTECHFSLSYCQGDGVAFYGDLDLDFLLTEAKKREGPPGGGSLRADRRHIQALVRKLRGGGVEVSVEIEGRNNRYHHFNSMRPKVTAEGGRAGRSWNRDDLASHLEKLLDAYLAAVSHDVEKIGYKELEYRDSPEAIDETMADMEYEFTESGSRWVPPAKKKRGK